MASDMYQNDSLSRKNLGVFYTPAVYAKKAAQLVWMAVNRVPEGNDYIILDRCAGCGALEEPLEFLYDKNGDSLLSHCVISSYHYEERKALQEMFGAKVRHILPSFEDIVLDDNGMIVNADAMSKAFIENPVIRQYVENPNCSVILYENPPYSDSTAISHTDTKKRPKETRRSFVAKEFLNDDVAKATGSRQATSRDLVNLFIWSGVKYYLRQTTDSYVVLAPVKYFKNVGLIKKNMLKGYAFNRAHFHATKSVLSCVLWANIDDDATEVWNLDSYDIIGDMLVRCPDIQIRFCHKSIQMLSDKQLPDFYEKVNFVCNTDGTIRQGWVYKKGRKPIWSDEIIAYMCFNRFFLGDINYNLVRCNLWKGLEGSYGFHLRKTNYLEKLPCFCAKLYSYTDWYDKDLYFTTADGGEAYTHDLQFLKACLIYTCLSNQNRCLSFDGPDGRRYQNELCFDDGCRYKSLALCDLENYASAGETALDDEEKQLLCMWQKVLIEARKTTGYNPDFCYGVYQIVKELNTVDVMGAGKKKKKVYDYPVLNEQLDNLRVMLKAYYRSHILEKMFQYELLK